MTQIKPAFFWQGAPSIFTTGQGQHDFNGTNSGKSKRMSAKEKMSPISLPGGSKNLPPDTVKGKL